MGYVDIQVNEAISYERKVGLGTTDPVIIGCQDGEYVVKNANNVHGPRVLINELVSYKLAKLLDLPIPDGSLININEELISSSEVLKRMEFTPGLHFGSKLIQRAVTNIQPPLIQLAKNLDDIPSIILFDQIIYNNDRTMNKGNLLFDIKNKMLLIIDHSHVFKLGAIWNSAQLKIINNEAPRLVDDFHGHNYKVLLDYVNGYNPFHKILTRMKNLSYKDIEWCCEGIPESWLLSEEDRKALIDFIWYRICNVDGFLKLLKNECPYWKGGGDR